jgi:hypothetical protein
MRQYPNIQYMKSFLSTKFWKPKIRFKNLLYIASSIAGTNIFQAVTLEMEQPLFQVYTAACDSRGHWFGRSVRQR